MIDNLRELSDVVTNVANRIIEINGKKTLDKNVGFDEYLDLTGN